MIMHPNCEIVLSVIIVPTFDERRDAKKEGIMQCCQLNFAQNRGRWRFFAKKQQYIATTPFLLHFNVVMNWKKIAKWPKLVIFPIFGPPKSRNLATLISR